MANCCDFEMVVRGKSEDVEIFNKYLTDYDNSPKYFARIFSAEIVSDSVAEDGIRTVKILGDCAWSVYSCMCEGKHTYYSDGYDKNLTSLREATKELNLEVEVRSTESGLNFWEHYRYKDGECLCDEEGELPCDCFDMENAA